MTDKQREPRHRIVITSEIHDPDGTLEAQHAKLVCDGTPSDWCHMYPDCMDEYACTSDDPDCEHPKTEHPDCVIVEWVDATGDPSDFYDGPDLPPIADGTWSMPRYHEAPVTVSTGWDDDGPTWQYDQAVLPADAPTPR
jgi:hypothetical protein